MTREQIYKAALERIEALQCTQPAVCDNHAALIAREALAAIRAAPVERPRYCPTCGAIGRQRLSKGSVCSDAFHGLQTAPVEALADDVEYRDIDGNVVSLFKLCATNPEWAASMIKRDRAGRK